ncbi:uncharacterized protein N7496_006875 [Penicillium cataractarum]|uniref:F-box domain-containing protein n=1 Tax=Penicillium cataractarum TaxID=2100454 RepID=A0A9W9S6Z2_9EURO|nr:uncharacterized protein N7496_006875 [Penicillium cataractarum]KAJ5370783.1 hypothetical protein N7496_006875 [Penicillium cataractarum]
MPLTSLPNEILQTIADNLENENEVNQFILTSRGLYSRLNDWFYRRNIREGGWALFHAAYNGREDTAKRLLRLGADANAKGSHHSFAAVRTVLGVAAWSEHYEMVKLLLTYAADPNERDSRGRTPIFYAAQNGNVSIVELLLKWGADVNIYDFSNPPETPLDSALTAEDSQGVVALLLDGGVHAGIVEGSALCRPYSPWSESSTSSFEY